MALVTGHMISNRNLAVIVDPKLANNNVVNSGCDLFVAVVIASVLELYVCIA